MDYGNRVFDIAGLGFTSANDVKPRNPEVVTVSVPGEGGAWIEVERLKTNWTGYWENIKFMISPITTSKIRFDFENLNYAETQLG